MTREFVTALQFLTRIRLFRDPDYDDGLFGRSVKFFPLVGLLAGSLLACVAVLTGGQQHVAQAAEFWVFCADFNRHLQIFPDAQLGLAEQLLLGVVDASFQFVQPVGVAAGWGD